MIDFARNFNFTSVCSSFYEYCPKVSTVDRIRTFDGQPPKFLIECISPNETRKSQPNECELHETVIYSVNLARNFFAKTIYLFPADRSPGRIVLAGYAIL